MADTDALIKRIDNVRFTPVRVREGYAMGEVDEFLDRLVAAARARQAFAPLVAEAHFTKVRMREGYSIEEVDAFLTRMAPVVPVADERVTREAAASPQVMALVERIRGAQFKATFFRPGYPFSEVDALLDDLVDAALFERSLVPVIEAAALTPRRGGQGYRPEDVDQFLRELTRG